MATEYKLSVLGAPEVGKTSLLKVLSGAKFNRKDGHKPTTGAEAVCYSFEVASSKGPLIFHLHDWAWAEKRRSESISTQLARGGDGVVFVYDVQSRPTLRDFADFISWYEQAAGYERPSLIVSAKNDSKKVQVQDGEGQALAKGRARGAYLATSLVDGLAPADFFASLGRLMTGDPNLAVTAVKFVSAV